MVIYARFESRIIAGIMDFVITLAITFEIFLFVTSMEFRSISTLWSLLGIPLVLAISGILAVISLVYYSCFELARGQTPGKAAMKIRVVNEDGSKCRAIQIFVRNVVRIIDFLPAFYILGLSSIMLTKGRKRLGDIAAKTIIIKAD
jgi:uncharacterized RDD family membrane protein YckC